MRIFNFPVKDASVYSEFTNRNTGLDEILEIGKSSSGNHVIRSLLQFSDFQAATEIPANANYELILYIANIQELNPQQRIEVCQVSQSWVEGTGYYYQSLIQVLNGVTWSHRYSGSYWPTGSQGGSILTEILTSSVVPGINEVKIDVTPFVREWVSGSTNNGVIVKFPDIDEFDTSNIGNIKFFSSQTHTIYRPTLVAKWDDALYITGSNPWPSSSLMVLPILKPSYKKNEIALVNLAVRERYPIKTFDNFVTRYDGTKYLPSSSYFSIIDDLSGTTIIPFSDESKISSSGNNSYFKFRIQNMYPLRYYRVLLKIVHDGLDEIFDTNTLFLVK